MPHCFSEGTYNNHNNVVNVKKPPVKGKGFIKSWYRRFDFIYNNFYYRGVNNMC